MSSGEVSVTPLGEVCFLASVSETDSISETQAELDTDGWIQAELANRLAEEHLERAR